MSAGEGLKLAVLGVDHNHIYGMLNNMMAQGCTISQWWTGAEDPTTAVFAKSFPDLERVADYRTILDDADVDMVLIGAVPADRAELAIQAMQAGKDVMVDKPGCTTLEQLEAIRAVVQRTGRIWTVNFSERFEVPCTVKAEELVAAGAIGKVKQTLGIGPHRQNLHLRPGWFFERERYGGILTDIGSHQIDQFLFFTGSQDVEIRHALVENTTLTDHPGFQDYGEVVLNGDGGHGYVRVDWFTPDGLPTWGDGRLTILGEEGYIELRKYADMASGGIGNQLLLANNDKAEMIDCRDVPLPYFPRLCADIKNRTETAVSQDHTIRVMELAITAQNIAEGSRS